jgi:hypothetical protein
MMRSYARLCEIVRIELFSTPRHATPRHATPRRDHGEETLAEIARAYNVSGWTISRLRFD